MRRRAGETPALDRSSGSPVAPHGNGTSGLQEDVLRYTIETRELTSESTHRPSFDAQPARVELEAPNADEAITRFVTEHDSQLVSHVRPARARESIATIRKNDTIYLVRVLEN